MAANITGWNQTPDVAFPILDASQKDIKNSKEKLKQTATSNKLTGQSQAEQDLYLNLYQSRLHKALLYEISKWSPKGVLPGTKQYEKYVEEALQQKKTYLSALKPIIRDIEAECKEIIENNRTLLKDTTLNLALVTDTSGTLEAITKVISMYDQDLPRLELLLANVADLTENEIRTLNQRNVQLYTFHYELEPKLQEFIENQTDIQINSHTIIYRLVQQLRQHLQEKMPKRYQLIETGRAEIKEIFKRSGRPPVLGCQMIQVNKNDLSSVYEGEYKNKISKLQSFKILDTEDEVIFNNSNEECITSIRHFKDEIESVTSGEFGLECFSSYNKHCKQFLEVIKPGYTVATFEYGYLQDRLQWDPKNF